MAFSVYRLRHHDRDIPYFVDSPIHGVVSDTTRWNNTYNGVYYIMFVLRLILAI